MEMAESDKAHELKKKVDLGCGGIKREGFIGIDRFPLPGVDIVSDLNQGIPLADDSVDYLIASHSLEHFEDLPLIIEEIYRVGKDRAIVTIIAPYLTTLLNLANPYHIQSFNEHTARFFTTSAECCLDSSDYEFPSIDQWGLATSDNSTQKADLRLLKCELFYMPPYRGLDDLAKRVLRRSLNDVVDQMVLQLIIVKTPMSLVEFRHRINETIFEDTPAVAVRRSDEQIAGIPNAFTALFSPGECLADLRAAIERHEEASRQMEETLSIRITAINTELVRRYNELIEKFDADPRLAAADRRNLMPKRNNIIKAAFVSLVRHLVPVPIRDRVYILRTRLKAHRRPAET